MSYAYNIHNIFQISSDVDLKLDYFKTYELARKYDLSIKLIKYEGLEKKYYQQIASGLYYSTENDSIFSDLRIFGIRIYWELKNILNKNTELRISKSYDFISKYIMLFQIASVHRLESLFRMILQIKLLMNNGTFLIGSATTYKEKCIIFSGTHGTGKTTAVLSFIRHFNSFFLSDDHMILFNNAIYNYPTLIKQRKYNLDFVSFSKYTNPINMFKDRLKESVSADYDIYFLEKSRKRFLQEIDKEDRIEKLTNINNKAIQYFNERLFSSLPYFYNELSLLNLQKRQNDILSSFFENAKFYKISADDGEGHINLIKDRY